MGINLIRGSAAQELLRDASFLQQWTKLYQACPWASACQSPGFATAWYGSYGDRHHPFFVTEVSPTGELIGLIALASDHHSGQATLAGGRQAEYKTWLALSANGSSFIEAALAELARGTDMNALSFRYLPPGTPTDWITQSEKRFWTCKLEQHPRPIIPVSDTAALTQYLQKKRSGKSVRNSFNRLKRLGNLTLERIDTVEQLEPIFDQLITYYDLRQGGSHGKFAFQQDPAKKPFHLALMRVPGLLHVTVLKAGDQILTAQFGVADGKVYSGAMPIICPFHAADSPMQVHLLLLLEKLQQERFSIMDLTASMDNFKERFAGTFDSVSDLSIYFRQRIKSKVLQTGQALARRSLRSVRIEPHAALEHLQQLRRVPLKTWPSVLVKNSVSLLKQPWSKKKFEVYVLDPQKAPPLDGPPAMSRDQLGDLLAFQPSGLWRTRQNFLAESLRRIEAGHHFYTRVENGKLLHFDWVIEDQKSNIFPGTEQEFQFPPGSAVLYGSYTDPAWRGHGLFHSALRQTLHDIAKVPRVNHVFTAVPAGDKLARHVVKKVGFVSV
jgi:CelD/BcsL family acetyltransferase involved in cellulose biosynthesis/GNAT superfamily N-acetyltransferase